MAKSIIKELIIVLLLCLAIILVLGILLYEYVPVSKTIPNEVSYTTPEEVKEELLTSSDVDENQIVMTYEIDSTDLNNYKKYKIINQEKQIRFHLMKHKLVDLMLVLVKHLDKIQLQIQIQIQILQMAVILQAVQIHHKVQIIQQHQVENFFKIQEQNNF